LNEDDSGQLLQRYLDSGYTTLSKRRDKRTFARNLIKLKVSVNQMVK